MNKDFYTCNTCNNKNPVGNLRCEMCGNKLGSDWKGGEKNEENNVS